MSAEREDLQLARRLFVEAKEKPFTALWNAWKKGALLPAVPAPVLMWGLEQGDGADPAMIEEPCLQACLACGRGRIEGWEQDFLANARGWK